MEQAIELRARERELFSGHAWSFMGRLSFSHRFKGVDMIVPYLEEFKPYLQLCKLVWRSSLRPMIRGYGAKNQVLGRQEVNWADLGYVLPLRSALRPPPHTRSRCVLCIKPGECGICAKHII